MTDADIATAATGYTTEAGAAAVAILAIGLLITALAAILIAARNPERLGRHLGSSRTLAALSALWDLLRADGTLVLTEWAALQGERQARRAIRRASRVAHGGTIRSSKETS